MPKPRWLTGGAVCSAAQHVAVRLSRLSNTSTRPHTDGLPRTTSGQPGASLRTQELDTVSGDVSVQGFVSAPGASGFQSCLAIPRQGGTPVDHVQVDLLSNFGNAAFTCLYSLVLVGVFE